MLGRPTHPALLGRIDSNVYCLTTPSSLWYSFTTLILRRHSLFIFYQFFHGNFSFELANCMPPTVPQPRCLQLLMFLMQPASSFFHPFCWKTLEQSSCVRIFPSPQRLELFQGEYQDSATTSEPFFRVLSLSSSLFSIASGLFILFYFILLLSCHFWWVKKKSSFLKTTTINAPLIPPIPPLPSLLQPPPPVRAPLPASPRLISVASPPPAASRLMRGWVSGAAPPPPGYW